MIIVLIIILLIFMVFILNGLKKLNDTARIIEYKSGFYQELLDKILTQLDKQNKTTKDIERLLEKIELLNAKETHTIEKEEVCFEANAILDAPEVILPAPDGEKQVIIPNSSEITIALTQPEAIITILPEVRKIAPIHHKRKIALNKTVIYGTNKIENTKLYAYTLHQFINLNKEEPLDESLVTEPIVIAEPMQSQQAPFAPTIEAKESSWAKMLREINWLNAVGIITLVLGIGFFVKYAIDQEWINEVGRVALGMVIGAGIIGIAHKMRKDYHAFSSVLVGGGFAIFYITITLAFREYEIFSQVTAFGILVVITLFAILLAISYNRQELAIFAFIGGMLAPLMVSSGEGNYIVLFSYILLLNTGILIVSIRNNWTIVDKISFVLTAIYMLTWLASSYQVEQIIGATIFATLLFVQFMLLILVRFFHTKQQNMSAFQLFSLFTINSTSLLYYFLIFEKYKEVNFLGIAVIFLALINGLIIFVLVQKKGKELDRNIVYTLLAITIGFASLAIPIQLNGIYITIVWVIEMTVLLWIWSKTRVNIFRVGSILIFSLAILSYLLDIKTFILLKFNENTGLTILPIILNKYTITGLCFIISLFICRLYILKNKIAEEETHGIKYIRLINAKEIKQVAYYLLLVFTFIVPYLELNYQLTLRVETINNTLSTQMRVKELLLFTFVVFYIAVNAYRLRTKITQRFYPLLFGITSVLLIATIYYTTALRYAVYIKNEYSYPIYILHLLPIMGLGYLYYLTIQNITKQEEQKYKLYSTLTFYSLALLCSIELDNIIVMIFGDTANYDNLISNIHSFGYPILWGVLAMVLMLVGISRNKAYLRKLSLISFGIIVVKFYVYDVWGMPQGGRIISFVVLGVIFLLVSFLLERIKRLVKEKDQND